MKKKKRKMEKCKYLRKEKKKLDITGSFIEICWNFWMIINCNLCYNNDNELMELLRKELSIFAMINNKLSFNAFSQKKY